jgi:hypothetical protein
MKKLLAAALILGFIGATQAEAQEIATGKSRWRMVRAMCTTGPCDPFLNFSSGAYQLNRLRQPKPLSKRKIGKVRLRGVTPPPNALEAEMTARFLWDTVDPDGDCPNLGDDVVQTLATSSMACNSNGFSATCAGELLTPIGLIDPRCTDVNLILQNINLEVYEFAGVGVDEKRLSVPGIALVGRLPDCSSGGSGCP